MASEPKWPGRRVSTAVATQPIRARGVLSLVKVLGLITDVARFAHSQTWPNLTTELACCNVLEFAAETRRSAARRRPPAAA
jgi:hypothetical protein